MCDTAIEPWHVVHSKSAMTSVGGQKPTDTHTPTKIKRQNNDKTKNKTKRLYVYTVFQKAVWGKIC